MAAELARPIALAVALPTKTLSQAAEPRRLVSMAGATGTLPAALMAAAWTLPAVLVADSRRLLCVELERLAASGRVAAIPTHDRATRNFQRCGQCSRAVSSYVNCGNVGGENAELSDAEFGQAPSSRGSRRSRSCDRAAIADRPKTQSVPDAVNAGRQQCCDRLLPAHVKANAFGRVLLAEAPNLAKTVVNQLYSRKPLPLASPTAHEVYLKGDEPMSRRGPTAEL